LQATGQAGVACLERTLDVAGRAWDRGVGVRRRRGARRWAGQWLPSAVARRSSHATVPSSSITARSRAVS